MPLFHLAMLSLIQGITEFLPISSSAHLILFPALTGVADQGLTIDLAVHVGTLAAVILFFRRDVAVLARGGVDILRGRTGGEDARLTLLIALASVPVVIVGVLVAAAGLTDLLRSAELIAWTTIVFGLALWAADRLAPVERLFGGWGPRDALVMGLAQACAIVPGVSRSGVTMTAARALGFARVDGARLSLLMAIPAIGAAGAYGAMQLVRAGDTTLGLDALMAAGLSFVAALLALAVMMRMLRTWSFTPFVLYRLGLGAILLWITYA